MLELTSVYILDCFKQNASISADKSSLSHVKTSCGFCLYIFWADVELLFLEICFHICSSVIDWYKDTEFIKRDHAFIYKVTFLNNFCLMFFYIYAVNLIVY